MNAGLDTSVVLRLLTGEPADQAAAAWRFIVSASSGGQVMVSDVVIGETYFALRHHYAVPHGEALLALDALLNDHRITASAGAREAVMSARATRGGAGFIDRLIHAGCASDDAKLITFDRAAALLPGANAIVP